MSSPAEQLARVKYEKATRKPRHRRTGKPVRKRVWVCAIREIRESLGLSLRDVAAATGYTVSGLWEIEHGTDPKLTTAMRLAEFYGCDVAELWPERARDTSNV